jgi:predicted DNA-binding transcriptional regulator YafY
MIRIDRISAILVLLQSRPVVKASQIATRFGVSLRTIYRDIRTLCEAGVPICGDAGVGYSLVDGYRLPPLMFTKEEAMAFLTAEKFTEQLTDKHNSLHYQQGMDKIRAVLRNVDKNSLSQLGENIEIYKSKRVAVHKLPNVIQTILNSIDTKRAVKMSYFVPSREEVTHRVIEPVGITYVYPFWYLFAYCHLRSEYRTFRLDRIEQIEITHTSYSREHPPLKTLIDNINNLCDASNLTKVVVQTTVATSQKMGDTCYFMGMVAQIPVSQEIVEQTYQCYSLDTMARWVLSNADTVTIIEPLELKEKVKEIARFILHS